MSGRWKARGRSWPFLFLWLFVKENIFCRRRALYRCKYLQPHYRKAKPIMLHLKNCFICDCVSVSQAFELRGHASSLCLYHQCKNVTVIKILFKCSRYSSSHLTWKHVSDRMHFRKIVASQNNHHGLVWSGETFYW